MVVSLHKLLHPISQSLQYASRKNLFMVYGAVNRYSCRCISYSDTIFALSSGHGKCGVAVIRVSGSKAGQTVQRLCRYKESKLPTPRVAHLCKFYDPCTSDVIDKGLILWFPGPRSFTGEDSAEFHVHGGPAVVAAMTSALGNIPGVRYAEAGDFTKRAFMNGKLDLTEVEGLGDLIHAETEAQRKQALRQMEGDLSRLFKTWRTKLTKLTADVEAYIDFGEDENIEDDVLEKVNNGVSDLQKELRRHLADSRQGERLRDGVHVVILGEPNVGKSSLLNAICQRPAAIVSPVAGTTRDVVETALNIGGYPVLLSDTAGLRETADIVEKEGVRRALSRARQSDVKVLVLDSGCLTLTLTDMDLLFFAYKQLQELGISDSADGHNRMTLTFDEHCSGDYKENTVDVQNLILVFNKSDLVREDVNLKLQSVLNRENVRHCIISCKTGEGIDDFIQVLKETVIKMCGNPLAGNPSLTQARHRSHLKQCVEYLSIYQYYMEQNDVVMAAQNLRYAISEFSKISGKITSEDILDVVFRDFCIGK